MKKILLFIAIIFSTHTQALEFQGKFLQGHFILGKAKIGSKVFIDKILSVGLEFSNKPIKIIKINKKIEFSDGERFISIEPSTLSLEIDFELKYKNQRYEEGR